MTFWSPRRTAVLIVLGGIVGAAAFVALRSPDPATSAQQPAARPTWANPPAGQSAVTDVKLEELKAEREGLERSQRDLFRFRPRAVAPSRPPAPAAKGEATPPVPAGPAPPPPIPLKFIGLLEASQTGRVAILSDARGNVFYGKEGDIIDGRYRMLKIAAESAELAYVDGRGRQVLRLSGQ